MCLGHRSWLIIGSHHSLSHVTALPSLSPSPGLHLFFPLALYISLSASSSLLSLIKRPTCFVSISRLQRESEPVKEKMPPFFSHTCAILPAIYLFIPLQCCTISLVSSHSLFLFLLDCLSMHQSLIHVYSLTAD